MAGENILIVEDDRNSARFLELELIHEGYHVEKEYDGVRGLRHALEGHPDLILLDVMLPGMDGMEVLRHLRISSDTPVIMLTARDAVTDKVTGLDCGADDYLTKPFAIEELLARMHAALKRSATAAPLAAQRDTVTWGKLQVNRTAHRTLYAGEPIALTKREFDLLFYLMSRQDSVCTREQLMEKVWGYTFGGETNLVDVYVRYLRSKIDYHFHVDFIQTIRGVGYIVRHHEEKSS